MKDLWKELMEYSHKLHLFDPYNNIILIIMVINAFNTTLYSEWTYIRFRFFSLNVNLPLDHWKSILKKTWTQFEVCNFLFSVYLYDYEHANVCWPHLINVSSGTTMSNYKKNTLLHVGLMRSKFRIGYSHILSNPCINKVIILILITSVNTTLATFCHWIYSGRNISEVLIFFKKT